MSKSSSGKKKLSASQQDELLSTLKKRFEKNMHRHKGLQWDKIESKLQANPDKLWSLQEMEATGGEPDVIALDKKIGRIYLFDCAPETPAGRRSICYDREGLESRKEHRPKTSAMDMAVEMGVELLTEEQYKELQKTGKYDTKTSSWLKTPEEVRDLGGALFADYRFGRVFIYHNGAQSYYGVRGFRAALRV